MQTQSKTSHAREKRQSVFATQTLSHAVPAPSKGGRYFRWSWPF